MFDKNAACNRLGITVDKYNEYFYRPLARARQVTSDLRRQNRKKAKRNKPIRQEPLRQQYRLILDDMIQNEGKPYQLIDIAKLYFPDKLNQAKLLLGAEEIDDPKPIYQFLKHAEEALPLRNYYLIKVMDSSDRRKLESVTVVSRPTLYQIQLCFNTDAVLKATEPVLFARLFMQKDNHPIFTE